jgi:hypothetical protein
MKMQHSRTAELIETHTRSMKNRFEDYCYVCGEVVHEQEGIAETIPRRYGDSGSGSTKWVVRHNECVPPKEEAS